VLVGIAIGLLAQATPAGAQEAPVLANDGASLARESSTIRSTFAAVYGSDAPYAWVREHERTLALNGPARPFRIAFLQIGGTLIASEPTRDAFVTRLRELGYAPGRDIQIAWYIPPGPNDPLESYVAAAVASQPDVILAGGTPPSLAAMEATQTIPVIFSAVGDPVGAGLVARMDVPDKNLTGTTNTLPGLNATRVELLKELQPEVKHVALLRAASNPLPAIVDEFRSVAEGQGVSVQVIDITKFPDELPAAFDLAVDSGATAIVIAPDGTFQSSAKQMARLAIERRLPLIAGGRALVVDGALLSAATPQVAPTRLAADYVDRVLKGAHPADLAVTAPADVEIVANRQTAVALGLQLPPAVLAKVTEFLP
jgi:putative ABC transport system substrate-binding protein